VTGAESGALPSMSCDLESLFDAHRLTSSCVPPPNLDLVAVGAVWCRLLAQADAT
jgi:hypothetical protein